VELLMRAREFLLEYNTAESQDLSRISRAVADYLTANPKAMISGNIINLHQIPMPAMSTPVGQALVDAIEVAMTGDAGIGNSPHSLKKKLATADPNFRFIGDPGVSKPYTLARDDAARAPGQVAKPVQSAVSTGGKLRIQLNTQVLHLGNSTGRFALQSSMAHELKHQADAIKGMDLGKLKKSISRNNWFKRALADSDEYEKSLLDWYKRNLDDAVQRVDPTRTAEVDSLFQQSWDKHQADIANKKKSYNPKLPVEYNRKVYLGDPTEVSARFEQAMGDVAKNIKKTTTNDEIIPLIKESFKKFDLYDTTSPTGWEDAQKNPAFKKLLTNSYKLIQAEIANPVIGTNAQYSLSRRIFVGLMDAVKFVGSEFYDMFRYAANMIPKAISEPVAAAAGKAMSAAAPFVRAAAPVVRAAASLPVALATQTDDLGPVVPDEGPYAGSDLDMTGRPWTPQTINSYNKGIKFYKEWEPWTPENKGMFQREVDKLIAKGITGEDLRKYLKL
jgi:hypothetical protein